jgi:rubrerythrin
MAIKFNANEVLAMAEQIERNAAAFYRKAASSHPAKHNQDFLLKLAAMEEDHERTFAGIRAQLPAREKEETAYDPMNEAAQYLDTLANAHGGEGSPAVTGQLTGKETLEQVLRMAIELEKKSILFYVGLKDLVPPKLGQSRVDDVIREEKTHVVILSRELSALSKNR